METMPAIFFGHGNPMNAIADNPYAPRWAELAAELPRPRAVLAISAHWYEPGVAVTAMESPRTIHDFGGFPRPLYEVQYPAPGDPQLAMRVQELLAPLTTVELDRTAWGLDHGTWSVLKHVFPDASVPIVQLRIDETEPPAFHYETGKLLTVLRDEGVWIVGSGNVVHNLHAYAWGRHPAEPFDWTLRFEHTVRDAVERGDDGRLVEYEALGRDAMLSAPTPDHYLPLLYVLGARRAADRVTFPVEGVDGGSISMLSLCLT